MSNLEKAVNTCRSIRQLLEMGVFPGRVASVLLNADAFLASVEKDLESQLIKEKFAEVNKPKPEKADAADKHSN